MTETAAETAAENTSTTKIVSITILPAIEPVI